MPSFDAFISDTVVPTKAKVIATFKLAKKYGKNKSLPDSDVIGLTPSGSWKSQKTRKFLTREEFNTVYLKILESKILPCDDDNSYVYGMNVAHANLIYNIKNGFLEKEKEQIIQAFKTGYNVTEYDADEYFDLIYNQNK